MWRFLCFDDKLLEFFFYKLWLIVLSTFINSVDKRLIT